MDTISVIIPAYNASATITRCVESVLSCAVTITDNLLFDIEVVIVDDGSTDNTLDIISQLAKADSRIVVLSQLNQGASSARRNGIKKSKGNVIAFCDSDDFVESGWLKKQYAHMVDYNADISCCRAIIKDHTTDYNPEEILLWDDTKIPTLFIEHKVFNGSLVVKMFKRNLFDNIKYDSSLRYYEDASLIWEMIANQRIKKVVRCNEGLYNVVVRQGSMTNCKINEDKLYSVTTFWSKVVNDCASLPQLVSYHEHAIRQRELQYISCLTQMIKDDYYSKKYEEEFVSVLRGGGVRCLFYQRGIKKKLFLCGVFFSWKMTRIFMKRLLKIS